MRITSAAHPVAVATYFWMATVGLVTVLGVAKSPSMVEILGRYGFVAWGLTVLAAGITAGSAALISPRLRMPLSMLVAEGVGAALLFFALVLYMITISQSGAVTTITLVLGFATGCAARAIQCAGEHRKLSATLR